MRLCLISSVALDDLCGCFVAYIPNKTTTNPQFTGSTAPSEPWKLPASRLEGIQGVCYAN